MTIKKQSPMNGLTQTVQDIQMKVSNMEIQLGRLVSDYESEKDHHKDANDEQRKERKEIENELKNVIYGQDRKSGMVADLVLIKEWVRRADEREQANKKLIWGGIIGVGTLLVKMFIDLFKK